MLPTVCFFNEFKHKPLDIYGLIESKLHLRETAWIFLKVGEQLNEFKKSLDEKVAAEQSKAENGNDLVVIVPEIDLNEDESSTSEVMEKYLEATEKSLGEETESSGSEASSNRNLTFTNTEIELLMVNFERLNSDQQKNLMKLLFHIKNTEPDRFKLLKSPFSSTS